MNIVKSKLDKLGLTDNQYNEVLEIINSIPIVIHKDVFNTKAYVSKERVHIKSNNEVVVKLLNQK